MKCPGFEQLIDYLDGRLDNTDESGIPEHLASRCPSCNGTREWYERVLALAASDDSVEPPPWVLKRALRIFGSRRERNTVGVLLGRAVASLIFDSFALPSLEGVRSTESVNRQLLYRAGDYSIDLQIASQSQSLADLAGQILREGESSFDSVAARRVQLTRGEEPVSSTATNAVGEFSITGIEPGTYALQVELSEALLVVEGLPVSASR